MKARMILFVILSLLIPVGLWSADKAPAPVRILVITGGHDYNKETFQHMLGSLGRDFTFEIREFPMAFDMFLPQNRDKYDVLVFYHMWQDISNEQKKVFSECIKNGKPLVVLHHSICAFDNWDEYIHITGGKYFHKPATINGVQYPASSYQHDRQVLIHVVDTLHPVTKNLRDFELFDETYNNYYIEPGVKPLLRTNDPTSTPVIGWVTQYGRSRVATIQSGHDTPTYDNENYRRLLRQAITWVLGSK